MKIIVSEEIESVCPTFVGACVEANVVNTPYCQELWDEINALGEKYRQTLTTESLKEMSGIAATRKVHFSVEKGEQGGRTFTRVVQLDRAQRQQELARLTGGASISATMLEGAGELLDQAEKFKKTLA